jgi:hypothetical protein
MYFFTAAVSPLELNSKTLMRGIPYSFKREKATKGLSPWI